jgi:hypothetical protein
VYHSLGALAHFPYVLADPRSNGVFVWKMSLFGTRQIHAAQLPACEGYWE